MPFMRTLIMVFAVTSILVLGTISSRDALAANMPELYFIDAHSQMPKGLDVNKIIPLMDQAGVWRTVLSARNDRSPKDVAEFALKHPDRITAAVRSKGRDFNNNSGKLKKFLALQAKNPVFQAMGEAILYHAKKGKKAPEISVMADSPQNQMLLNIALKKGWPFIAHYEFRAAQGKRAKHLKALKAMMRKHSGHPFVLIHMGQLGSKETKQLIADFSNVYFIMSHSNPVSMAKNPGQPWTNLFEGKSLAPKWKKVILAHPDRFIAGFDNVWPDHWGSLYLNQVKLWRKTLRKLPPEAAHALAHGNAERLWKLTPR